MFIKSFYLFFFAFLCLSQFQFCAAEADAEKDADADADADINDDVPVIRVDQGLIKGIKDKSTEGKEFNSYLGIPYAEPPVGKLRLQFQRLLGKVFLDGTIMSVSCLQTDFFDIITDDTESVTINGREDCLQLNVFTSAPNQQKKLPVMVYIHGGGFISGGATYYHPYYLLNRDIVLVVIQYRLGIFGFLSTEDSVIPGNMGLKDQQLALKWIKGNIESFGGDSNRITIFGGSAGGASVNYQILSPGSKGLFRRAILQSGTSLCPWASNKNHRKFATEAGREFGCDIDSEKYLECMQNVNPYYLVLAAEKTNYGFVVVQRYEILRTSIDGALLL
ncbi:Venom carboxylesterase-6 [Armadillidium nasatum]|uniref:Carboxylic ester hydrolase n=1 Tax=Armadillidium nasatum TaxID=96803 RepID=A0A5N5SQE0_9CRUS|nr:Venom carboxylesterase-6 [Armadillidium nasatum]